MDASQICGMLDADLVGFIHNIIVLLKIAVPIVLIILGMLDLFKGVISSKEDEIKKGQQIFIKRLIAGVLVFLVVTIVQLVMGFISKEDGSFWECADAIMNGTAGTSYDNFDYVPSSDADDRPYLGPEVPKETEINSENSGLTGVHCTNDVAYQEYRNCLNNMSLPDKVCHTILQSYCTSTASEKMWATSSNYDESIIDGISCLGTSNEMKSAIKKQLYSCYVSMGSLNQCLNFIGGYCYQ